MTASGRYAIIPTRNRPTELAALVTELHQQHVTVVVVDNGSEPRAAPPVDHDTVPLPNAPTVIVDYEQPPNLSRFWNVAFDEIQAQAHRRGLTVWDVGVFNDDTVIPPGWFDAVSAALRAGPAAAASSDPYGTMRAPLLKTQPDHDVMTRMCPWAFIVRGELGLRADEDLRWWYGDTQFDHLARQSGGVAIIPGFRASNVHANSTTVGELAEQAGRDRETFARKYGGVPW